MKVRETVVSLRAYFIVVSIVEMLASVLSVRLVISSLPIIAQLPLAAMLVLFVSTAINFSLSIMFLYTGVRLPKLLQMSPRFVLGLIYVLTAWVIVSFLFSLRGGPSVVAFVYLIAGLLVAWYLWRSTKRLCASR
jgi:hypothetical protein